MNNRAAHTRAWETFEIVFGIPLIISLVLGYLLPLPLSLLLPRLACLAIGTLLLATGLAIIILARRQFHRSDQPTDPGMPTTRLITTGPFSWSRNPLYLGGVIALIGIAALLNSLWSLILLLPAVIAAHYLLIVPEEHYLQDRFGDAYRQYAGSVRRWFGKVHER